MFGTKRHPVPDFQFPAAHVLRNTESEYRVFPDIGRRNWLQEHLEIPIMLTMLGLPRGARVLEVGCGRGVALPVFLRHLAPAHLVGLDLDATLLAQAQERLPRNTPGTGLVQADVRRLPFRDAAFDIVIDFGTCYHIARPGNALREIERVLVPGGMFVTETRLSQLLSHPVRTRGRRLPWGGTGLSRLRRALLWQSHRRAERTPEL
ncbi:MAG TPA: class I SAM-dependent methyltransferase [Longimicrobiales bacterium]|nr:class I SAM-dependent methyltransferase [Longimicrobiales bacterium]